MFLVHENKSRSGKWEVAWMWLPHFLAADSSLHRYVGKSMTEAFKGETLEDNPAQANAMLLRMHSKVLELILEKYPIPGLRQYLESIIHLQPEEEIAGP